MRLCRRARLSVGAIVDLFDQLGVAVHHYPPLELHRGRHLAGLRIYLGERDEEDAASRDGLALLELGGHGHIRKQPQIFEVTRAKKVVGVIDDWKQFGTLSGVCVTGIEGDATKFEVTR